MELIEQGLPKITLEQGFSYIKKGELGKAISVMDELIKNDPYLAQAYWGRALCLEYRAVCLDDTMRAIADYTKSIIYSEEPSTLSYGRRGILYFKAGMYGDALNDLNKALAADLFWIEARFYRGRTYISLDRDLNDARLAEDDFSEVIKHAAQPFAPAYFWRAQARRLLDKAQEAVSDYEKTLEIDPEDVLALNALAYCNEHGIGVSVNRSRAEELYVQAAERGFIIAQKNLAWFYSGDDDRNDEDAESSAYWMRRAAVEGDAEAQTLYALRRLHGKGVPRDEYKAIYYFKLAAKQDYPPALCHLAECYEQGAGVDKDDAYAFQLYEKAVRQGSVQAIYNVGRCYYFGIGVAENNDIAFAVLKPLADDGYARAQDIIGMCYENGYGVQQDLKLAGKYFRAAYAQGHVHAGVHLASRYRAGRGIRKNLSEAVRLYKESGERGSSYAWYALGRLYFEDKCDYDKAASAFRRAIDEGEDNVSVWLARSLMCAKNPEAHIGEIHSLLKKSVDEEADKLHAAMFLCDLDYYGIYGWPPDAETAVKRIEKLIFEDGGTGPGLSCAYYFLAQASELGLGAPYNPEKAVELYLQAGKYAEAGGCRCFVAGFAHMLYQGVGCAADMEAADGIVEDEMQSGNPCNEIKLLYIWSKLKDGGEAGRQALINVAGEVLRETPHDPIAVYMLYYLHRGESGEKRCLNALRKALKTASPYFAIMIEEQMGNACETPLYPMLTAKIIDAYNNRSARMGEDV